jgi:hypothetical protein
VQQLQRTRKRHFGSSSKPGGFTKLRDEQHHQKYNTDNDYRGLPVTSVGKEIASVGQEGTRSRPYVTFCLHAIMRQQQACPQHSHNWQRRSGRRQVLRQKQAERAAKMSWQRC